MSLYDVLGVPKTSTTTEIRKAYLKLARIHHPDKGGDPEKFKEITRANDILTDENRRALYDQHGVTDEQAVNQGFPGGFPGGFPFPGGGGMPFEFNMNDLFGNMFGQKNTVRKGRKPPPIQQQIAITLEQFYLGHQFDVHINRQGFCKDCGHTGAASKEMCKKCSGQGHISQAVNMGPFMMHTKGPCMDCQGKGERIIESCKPCGGSGFINERKNLTVKIAPGTGCNEVVQFMEVCSDNVEFEQAGDVHITLQPDLNDKGFTTFRRISKENLETTVVFSLSESLMGCVVQLDGHPGYDEGLFVHLPPSFHGDTYQLKGFGMPIQGSVGKYGSLFLKVEVVVSPVERKLYLSKGRGALVEDFLDKIRPMKCDADVVQMEAELV